MTLPLVAATPARARTTRQDYDAVMVPNYTPAPIVPVRGQGATLWDQQGRDYIDLAGGVAVNALGHGHPALLAALQQQSAQLWHVSNVFANEPATRLARALVDASFAERVFFVSSGAEANETAFKLARRHGLTHGGPDKYEIIAASGSFHGRTLFTVQVAGQAKYSEGFGPSIAGIRHVPFNDIEALRAAMSARTCAVVLEPIQGESGVLPATVAYLAAARALCDQHQALLIFDEVQTGLGRLGTLFGYQHFGVTPDIMTLAKALGCGVPLAAMLTTDAIAAPLPEGWHGSTFGGNPLNCAVGAAALQEIARPEVLAGVQARHDALVPQLQAIGQASGLFSEVRGIGLLLGAVLAPRWRGQARAVMQAALAQGVMVLQAGQDVIRFAPSLLITPAEMATGLARLASAAQQFTHQPNAG